MRTFVITLKELEFSKQMAERCRKTAKEVGYKPEIETFWGVFADDWVDVLPKTANCPMYRMGLQGSETVAGCFASHYLLWKKCIELNEPIVVLEHDARFLRPIPEELEFDKFVTFAYPSFFRAMDCTFIEPQDGLHPMRDDIPWGHHAYAISPEAAKIFCDDVEGGKRLVLRNDLFTHKKFYPWMQEYYPWAVTADQQYSTISMEGKGLTPGSQIDHKTLTEEQYDYFKRHFQATFLNCRLMIPEMKEKLNARKR